MIVQYHSQTVTGPWFVGNDDGACVVAGRDRAATIARWRERQPCTLQSAWAAAGYPSRFVGPATWCERCDTMHGEVTR